MRGKGRGRARRRTQVGERREPAREERGSQLGISKADLLEHAPVHPRAPEVGKLRRRLREKGKSVRVLLRIARRPIF